MLRRAVRAALLLLALTHCGWALEGGSPARPGDPLAMATVAVGTINAATGRLGLNHCSGVLIGPDLVLTAAHCVRDNPVAAGVLLYNGSKPVGSIRWATRVATTVVPPGRVYARDLFDVLHELSFDIAVVRLAEPVRGRTPLPFVGDVKRLPRILRLAGVGWAPSNPGTLKTATLQPILVTDTGLTIAKALDSRVCVGDSGGPVVVHTKSGPRIWGVAAAVISPRRACSPIVVIAPAGLARIGA